MFMKTVASLLTGLIVSVACGAAANEPPRGTLLELHSCQLYAGGCIVSGEATLCGHYMVRAWNFTGGTFEGMPLAGLDLGVLQAAQENLAVPGAGPGQIVVYLPASATDFQRQTLLAWLKSAQPELGSARLQTRTVPLNFANTPGGCTFSAGTFISVQTAPVETCPTGSCGESLWYSPRSANSVFTVVVDRCSNVSEPLLHLRWAEGLKRNVFLAKFGESSAAKNLYVSLTDLCGAKSRVF